MIYFDHAAAMPVSRTGADFYQELLLKYPGNSESRHQCGAAMREALKNAEKNLLETLHQYDKSAVFFNSGSDIFNFLSFAVRRELPRDANIVATCLEHPALLQNLERIGAEIRWVQCSKTGVDAADLAKKIDKKTVLCAMFHVQSETGILNDFTPLIPIIRNQSPKCRILADTIQSIGKIPVPETDFLTMSGHKLGTPGGAVLFFDKKYADLKQAAEVYRHEFYFIGRTEIPPVILLSRQYAELKKNQVANYQKVAEINQFLRANLPKIKLKSGDSVQFTTEFEHSSAYILHLLIPNYQGAILAGLLSEKNLVCSSSSACTAESNRPSPALAAINIDKNLLFSGLRLSFSAENTLEEAKVFLSELQAVINNY